MRHAGPDDLFAGGAKPSHPCYSSSRPCLRPEQGIKWDGAGKRGKTVDGGGERMGFERSEENRGGGGRRESGVVGVDAVEVV